MNSIKLYCLVLLVMFWGPFAQAQESTNAAGGDAIGSNGSIAYSIGQVAYVYASGTNGDANQGVQQPYEIFLLGTAEDQLEVHLLAFPNPTSDQLHLHFEEFRGQHAQLTLTDITGKILLERQIAAAKTELDLSPFSSGTYFLRVMIDPNTSQSFKIIKN